MHRCNTSNLVSIIKGVDDYFSSNPRKVMNTLLTNCLLDTCLSKGVCCVLRDCMNVVVILVLLLPGRMRTQILNLFLFLFFLLLIFFCGVDVVVVPVISACCFCG